MKPNRDEIEARLTAADRAHLFRALGIDPESGKRGPDGWVHELRRPHALGSDRNPSFCVNLETGACKDFGSDYTADLYRLVQDVRRCTFPEALEWIASALGMAGGHPESRGPAIGSPARSVPQSSPPKAKHRWDPFKTDCRQLVFPYLDEAGTELFQVVRFEVKEDHPAYPDKTFRQRHFAPDDPKAGPDGYVWRQPERLVPYQLPAVIEAARAGRVVFIGEGEKVVHALRDLGFVATCNPGGAAKWRESFSDYLRGAHVVILPDNDEQGRNHAQTVARLTEGKAASVRVVELPGLAYKGDVVDWKAAGHTAEELKALVQAAPVWEPPDAGEAGAEEDLPALPQRAYDLLPEIIAEGCRCFREWHERDVFLSGALATCSAMLPRVRFRYGKDYYSPHLYLFILAMAGRGKGTLKHALSLSGDVDELLQAEYAQARYEWEERKRAYEQAQRSRRKDSPPPDPPGPEPPEVLLRAAEDMTLPALYKTLSDNPEGVLIGATEADIISQANRRGDFGGFSALFRQAFHHEDAGKSTKSEGTVRAKEPRIALAISGTEDQFEPLVEGVLNGLFSRFIVYRFHSRLEYRSQRPTPEDDAFGAYMTKTRARLCELYGALRARTEPLYVDTPAVLWDRIDAAFRDLFNRVLKDADAPDELAASIYRAVVIAFRIAAVLCVLRRFEEGKDLRSARSLDVGEDDVEAALSLSLVFVEQSMRQALRMLEPLMKLRKPEGAMQKALSALSQTGGAARMTGQQRTFFDALPAAFETARAVEIGTGPGVGVHERTVKKWLRKLCEAGMIEQPEHGVYRKKGAARGTMGTLGTLAESSPETAFSEGHFAGSHRGTLGTLPGGGAAAPGDAESKVPKVPFKVPPQNRPFQAGNGQSAQSAQSAPPLLSAGAHAEAELHGDGLPDDAGYTLAPHTRSR